MSAQIPDLLGGRYEVGDLIGRGGMAEVHRGHDTRLGRPVAIKILRTDHARDTTFLQRFRREAQSVAGLNHTSIVAVYDSGEDHVVESGGSPVDVPYIIMEYVHGKTLRTILNERGSLTPAEAARITEGVLDALAYSHRMGIIHRDIKPGNVMVAEDGAVKVMDFGIARAIADSQATMTQTHTVIGTAQYLSPEQAEGHTVDARSDLYSTGCLLFELLTGETPFSGDPVSLTYQHVGKLPPLPSSINPDIPPEMDAVVLHALEKDREVRYQDAAAFRADLQAARLGLPISTSARRSLSAADAALAAGLGAGVGMAAAGLSGAGPGATEVIRPGQAEPTAYQPTAVSGPYDDEPTSSWDQTRRQAPEEERKGAWKWVLLVIALLAAVGLLAFAGMRYFDSQQGPEPVAVPGVVGEPLQTARGHLEQAGFDTIEVKRKKDADAPKNEVTAQDPGEGEEVVPSTTITLTVSSGPGTVTVPSLEGLSVDEAQQTLEDADLKLGDTTEVDDPNHDRGEVVSSDPAEGTDVDPGTTVDLEVASGTVTLPDFVGQPYEQAKAAAAQLGLKVTSETQPSNEPKDNIIGQDPGGGQVDVGSEVHFIVSGGAPESTSTSTTTSSSTTTTSSSTTTTSPTTTSPTSSPTSTSAPGSTSAPTSP
jgi:beta-lactam-binding protein with PASTA domain/predicted Ser/Thr protein kinase